MFINRYGMPRDFHQRMPGYEPTALIDARTLARTLGAGRIWLKDETQRLGLPSFKILGASWAVYAALCDQLGAAPEPWTSLTELAERLSKLSPLALAAATDGNHGRAVARMARLLGFEARIFVPGGTAQARIDALMGEGASVTVVDGDYDTAVGRSAQEADVDCLVISDVSWSGLAHSAQRVIDGYQTIFEEVDEQLAEAGERRPDIVVVPVGVGALMAAAVQHYRARRQCPILVGVEPATANCLQASVLAGTITTVPGPHPSIMAGLNCGTPSRVAWPAVSSGVDWFVSIADDHTEQAMVDLARIGVEAGETGAAALAGIGELLRHRQAELPPQAHVLVLVTEGPTDPENYERIVGRKPAKSTIAVGA